MPPPKTKPLGRAAALPWLALAGLLPFPAAAQSIAADAASAAPTNAPAWLKTSQPLQLSWGAFDFHPRLREGVVYDDNILFSPQNKESDVINQLAPGLQIVGGDRSSLRSYESSYEDLNQTLDLTRLTPSWLVLRSSESWPDKFMLLDYSPRWQMFTHHSANDSLDQFLTFNTVWPMSKLVVGVRQDYSYQKTTIVQAYTRNEVEQIHSEVDAGYRLNEKFSVDSAFERQQMSYPGSTNLTGYVEWKGTASLNRQIIETFNVSLVFAGGHDDVAPGLNQNFEQLGGRVRYDYSRLFSLDGSVGVEDRQFDSGRGNAVNPVFTVGAVYKPWERTYLRAGIARQQTASLFNNYYNSSIGGYLTLHKDITDRFSLQTDVSYYQTDSTPIQNIPNTSQPSDYYSVLLKGNLKLLKYLDAQAFYVFRGSGISQNNNVLQDNQCGLQLSLHY